MAVTDGFTWLKHNVHGGYFRCPDGAMEDWAERGWYPSEAPPEVNLATIEQTQPAAPPPADDPKPPKTKATAPEGTDN